MRKSVRVRLSGGPFGTLLGDDGGKRAPDGLQSALAHRMDTARSRAQQQRLSIYPCF